MSAQEACMATHEAQTPNSQGEPSTHDTGTATGENWLATQLSELARQLEGEDDTDAVLADIVQAAVTMIPGVEEGSISVVIARKQVRSHAASGELPKIVDGLQDETGEGPCLDAVFEQKTVRVPDMAAEKRWPHFAQRAAQAGALAMLSFQLYVDGDNLGALNLYARTPDAFTDESEQIGLLFASHAAIAYSGVHKQENLQQALDTRDLIGQAKGILMERYKLSGSAAFDLLTRVSNHSNTKLRDVADHLIHQGLLPGQLEHQ
jgi:transcriptional regulator with GAF, ATPase, and Fis domain